MSVPWLITAAMEGEIRALRKGTQAGPWEGSSRPRGAWLGRWQGQPVLLIRTGAGPGNARQVLSPLLARQDFRGILSTGSAGALRDGYRPGDIVVPAEVRTIPPLPEYRIVPDPELRSRLLSAVRRCPWRVHTDPIMLTSSRVILTSQEKRRLGEAFHAGSVEMESAIVGELAARASVPFAVIRVILDEASFSFEGALEILRHGLRRQYGRLVLQGVVHPAYGLWLARLGCRSQQASRRLGALYLGYLLDELTGPKPRKQRGAEGQSRLNK